MKTTTKIMIGLIGATAVLTIVFLFILNSYGDDKVYDFEYHYDYKVEEVL